MKDKIEIVLRLLTEGQITIDEAVILLEKEVNYINLPNIQYPPYPIQPYYTINPYTITSSSDLEDK